jgi:hypothetical protein
LKIRYCAECNRPFRDLVRLAEHTRTWHHDDAPKPGGLGALPLRDSSWIWFTVDIVPKGDLFISSRLERTPLKYQRYRVASQVLWTASTVFRTTFGPDSNNEDALKLRRASLFNCSPPTLQFDDPDQGLKVVLRALHHVNNFHVQHIGTFERFVEVAIICQKYKLQNAMQPHADRWLGQLVPLLTNTLPDFIDSLLIAWVFRYEKLFISISKKLILEAEWRGSLTFGNASLSSATPGTLIGKTPANGGGVFACANRQTSEGIAKARLVHVNKLRERIIYEGKLRHTTIFTEMLCRGPCDKVSCFFFQLGHYTYTVAQHGMHEDKFWCRSLNSLVKTFEELKGMEFPGHSNCSWVHRIKGLAKDFIDRVNGFKLSDFDQGTGGGQLEVVAVALEAQTPRGQIDYFPFSC